MHIREIDVGSNIRDIRPTSGNVGGSTAMQEQPMLSMVRASNSKATLRSLPWQRSMIGTQVGLAGLGLAIAIRRPFPNIPTKRLCCTRFCCADNFKKHTCHHK